MEREYNNWTEVWDNDADADMDDYFPFDYDDEQDQALERQFWHDYEMDC